MTGTIQSRASQPARNYQLPTKANTPSEDQLEEVFDLWIENNTTGPERNIGITHPEAAGTAMAMIQQATTDVFGDDEMKMVLPGARLPVEDAQEGQFALALHPIGDLFKGDDLIQPEAVATLFVDTTPGEDGTLYSVSVKE